MIVTFGGDHTINGLGGDDLIRAVKEMTSCSETAGATVSSAAPLVTDCSAAKVTTCSTAKMATTASKARRAEMVIGGAGRDALVGRPGQDLIAAVLISTPSWNSWLTRPDAARAHQDGLR